MITFQSVTYATMEILCALCLSLTGFSQVELLLRKLTILIKIQTLILRMIQKDSAEIYALYQIF